MSLIIDHIVKYQDNFVSFRMFKDIFLDLLHKELELTPLLMSNIFYKRLEFEDWPSAHTNLEKMFIPFNGSLFEMRHSYDQIFPDLGDPQNDDKFESHEEEDNESNKYYSIVYKVNLLPSVIYEDESEEPKPGKLLDAI